MAVELTRTTTEVNDLAGLTCSLRFVSNSLKFLRNTTGHFCRHPQEIKGQKCSMGKRTRRAVVSQCEFACSNRATDSKQKTDLSNRNVACAVLTQDGPPGRETERRPGQRGRIRKNGCEYGTQRWKDRRCQRKLCRDSCHRRAIRTWASQNEDNRFVRPSPSCSRFKSKRTDQR